MRNVLLIAGLLSAHFSFSQNLIPNSSFEDITCPENSINSIVKTSSWYAVNSDAYWIHADCPIPRAIAEPVFGIDPDLEPFDQEGYISLEGGIRASGITSMEGVGIALDRPMQAGKAYLVEWAYADILFRQGNAHPGLPCGDIPDRHLSLWAGMDSIRVGVVDTFILGVPVGKSIQANAKPVITKPIEPKKGGLAEWRTVSGCFIAPDDASHIALIGDNEMYAGLDNCREPFSPGILYFMAVAIDNLVLYEVPESLSGTSLICPDGGWVDLSEIVPGHLFAKASFAWEDGCTDARRIIREPGRYQVRMILDCVEVPVSIEVSGAEPCLLTRYDTLHPADTLISTLVCTDRATEPLDLRTIIPQAFQAEMTVRWTDGRNDLVRELLTAGNYEVAVSSPCHTYFITIQATEETCLAGAYIPNAFSPNGDGRNDEFRPYFSERWSVLDYKLIIRDRWGNVVFQSNDPTETWSGRGAQGDYPQGSYFYQVAYSLDNPDQTRATESGTVQLIR